LSLTESVVAVEWLEGGKDHGDGLDHCEGLVMFNLADGGQGCVEKLSAG